MVVGKLAFEYYEINWESNEGKQYSKTDKKRDLRGMLRRIKEMWAEAKILSIVNVKEYWAPGFGYQPVRTELSGY